MNRRGPRRILVCAFVMSLVAAPWVAAAPQTPQQTGWYTVRAGDTLRDLSRRLSGQEALWEANWRLNPDLRNPHLLAIGLRLKLYLSQPVPAEAARVMRIHRQVDQKPEPMAWESAQVDQLLQDKDGVRTRERSSTRLGFGDGSQLSVSESSLVFMRRIGSALRGVPRDEIEIVSGQGDLEAERGPTRARGIDIVLGGARAAPQPGEDGSLKARARRPGGGAQLMVYEGTSDVEAKGAKVAVGRGMGTNVPEGKAPLPPEKLLDAPRLIAPPAGTPVEASGSRFRWDAVPGAASYLFELCEEPGCERLLARANVSAPEWQPSEPLPPATYHWRVTAVSASGLDGYPAQSAALIVVAGRLDREAPKVAFTVSGPRAGCGQRVLLGPGGQVLPRAEDTGSGLADWTLILDGQPVTGAAWGSLTTGQHRLEGAVRDRAGNIASLPAVEVYYDDVAPLLEATRADAERFVRFGQPGTGEREPSRRELKALEKKGARLEWSSDGRLWLPLVPASGPEGVALAASDRPQIFVRGVAGSRLAEGELLHITARDEACGVETLRFGIGRPKLATSGGAPWVLWVEAVDLVGNLARREWELVEKGRR
ncbi:MAG TPA: LysM domain-containing protein [Thermoanaerobaculia bacterium]|nr:LysM domain-containing protein [Thermoanaerobaculia bacterium]